MEATFTMVPPLPRSIMRLPAAWLMRKVPRTLTAITRSNFSGGISVGGAPQVAPELLTSTSTLPKARSASATTLSTLPPSVTSSSRASALRPRASISSLTSSSGSSLRAQSTTLAPASERASAMWRPSPRPPPVTMAVLPSRRKRSSVFTRSPSLDYGAAPALEHPERPGAQGHEVAIRVVDLRLGGSRPAGAVEDLALAGYAPRVDGAEEVDVHLDGGRPHPHQRQDREAHGGVYERGVDPAVQGAGAVEVDLLDGDAYDRASRLDPLDLRPHVPGEGHLLVEVSREALEPLPAQRSSTVVHQTSPSVTRAAGHVEDLPAHERGLLRGEEQDRRRHVLGPPGAARGYLLHHLLHELL